MANRRFLLGLLVWLACQFPQAVHGNQNSLVRARELYLSADYEGALAVLDTLRRDRGDTPPAVAEYRLFCLFALDRVDEARQVIRTIVETDPFYRLSEAQASPRLRGMFQETRKALLPGVVQRIYSEAKASFDRRDPGAEGLFDRLIHLLDDPDISDVQRSDLRAVVTGFRDLSRASVAEPVAVSEKAVEAPEVPAPAAAAIAAPSRPLTGPPDTIRVTTRGATPLFTPKDPPPPGLQPPLAIAQTIPQWSVRGKAARENYRGVLEIVIDDTGAVTSVALQQPMQPAFDAALLKAARSWKFQPALFNGTPVPFLKVIEFQFQPER